MLSSRVRCSLASALLLILGGVASLDVSAVAAPSEEGDPDPQFGGGDGWVETSLGGARFAAADVVYRPGAGRVVVGTTSTEPSKVALISYDYKGALVTSFGTSGVVITQVGSQDVTAYAAAPAPDARTVVVGSLGGFENRDIVVMRYRSNGELDTSFAGDGIIATAIDQAGGDDIATSVAVLPDGKIVVAGSTGNFPDRNVVVLRYLQDGTLDKTFGDDGIVVTPLWVYQNDQAAGVAVDTRGHVVVAATAGIGDDASMVVVRYLQNGTLDASFNKTGTAWVPAPGGGASAIDIDLKARPVVAGQVSGDMAAWRFTDDGRKDGSFGTGGRALIDFQGGLENTGDVLAARTGSVLIVGSTIDQPAYEHSNAALLRLTSGGVLDTRFGGDGVVYGPDETSGFASLAYDENDARLMVGGTHGDAAAAFNFLIAPWPDVVPPKRCYGRLVTVDLGEGDRPSDGPDVIFGTARADRIIVRGDDTVCALEGDDEIRVLSGSVVVDAGSGDDQVFGGSGDDAINGGGGTDHLEGGGGADRMDGAAGFDTLLGEGGNDVLGGGAQDDIIRGGDGDDVINGGAGFDELHGENGADRIDGGRQNDSLDGGNGTDRCDGGGDRGDKLKSCEKKL